MSSRPVAKLQVRASIRQIDAHEAGAARYFGYLFNMRPDTYQVRMLHENDDLTGATRVVHEQTVVIS